MKQYRLPKAGQGATYKFSLDLLDVEETEPAVLTIDTTDYPGTIADSQYVWDFVMDLDKGEYDYVIDVGTVRMLFGRIEVV